MEPGDFEVAGPHEFVVPLRDGTEVELTDRAPGETQVKEPPLLRDFNALKMNYDERTWFHHGARLTSRCRCHRSLSIFHEHIIHNRI